MGTWGTGIFANDLAGDLEPLVRTLLRTPLDADGIIEACISAHRSAAEDAHDDDHSSFWLALALLLHRSGVDAPAARERARTAALVDTAWTGTQWEKERAGVVRRTLALLETPVGRDKRKRIESPQPLPVAAGDCLVWKPCDLVPASVCYDRNAWPNGHHAGAVVTTAAHRYGVLATVVLLVVELPGAVEPTLERFAAAHVRLAALGENSGPLVGAVESTPWPKRVRNIGRLHAASPMPSWLDPETILRNAHQVQRFTDFATNVVWLDPGGQGPALSDFYVR